MLYFLWFLAFSLGSLIGSQGKGIGTSRLVCYYEEVPSEGAELCTHIVFTGKARAEKLDGILKDFKSKFSRVKFLLRVSEDDKNLNELLKSQHVHGLEIFEAHRSLNRTKVTALVEKAKAAVGSSSKSAMLALALPAHPELLAKYYDLRVLMKSVDLIIAHTHSLGRMKKMTYHSSRLSGLWDMMNTDSIVDLVIGLGATPGKLVVTLPAAAHKFTLGNESLSTPGSPAKEDFPDDLNQAQLCEELSGGGKWTLERDQDLSAPYAFRKSSWISFEDASSVDVKGKYARVRGLAGLGLADAGRDATTTCGPSILTAMNKALNAQSRAPRGAVLRSLETEILSSAATQRTLDVLQVSPYRITQVVDSDGVIHSIREDTRTEFTCSRQGYFVHPRSCGRFYRCVKFDQLSPDYTVFEFDCPAGLAFDSRWEVCVWPGSISDASACPGSSEIAPVPRTRFICPEHTGYYADPENCRWFFACLDHGKAPLTAYEFRCPFGLGFDADRLLCDWPWLVPECGNIARYEAEAFGFSAAKLTGGAAFSGHSADYVNIAAHNSLISGATTSNLVGLQSGYNDRDESYSRSLSTGIDKTQNLGNSYVGTYNQGIDSGSYNRHAGVAGTLGTAYTAVNQPIELGSYNAGVAGTLGTAYTAVNQPIEGGVLLAAHQQPNAAYNSLNNGQSSVYYKTKSANANLDGSLATASKLKLVSNVASVNLGLVEADSVGKSVDSGAYVHDNSGDYYDTYQQVDAGVNSDAFIKLQGENKYKYKDSNYNGDGYVNSVKQTTFHNAGDHQSGVGLAVETPGNGAYNQQAPNTGTASYQNINSGVGQSGSLYNSNYDTNAYAKIQNGANIDQKVEYPGHVSYSSVDSGNQYVGGSTVYPGISHTLTAGAVNVDFVGKTTLVDANLLENQRYASDGATSSVSRTDSFNKNVASNVAFTPVKAEPIGFAYKQPSYYSIATSGDEVYASVTPSTASQYTVSVSPSTVYTTAAPIAVTTFKPTLPKSDIREVFGYSKAAVTNIQPVVHVTNYNEPVDKQYSSQYINNQNVYTTTTTTQSPSNLGFSGYTYAKPTRKFEENPSKLFSQVTTIKPVVLPTLPTYSQIEASSYKYDEPSISVHHTVQHHNAPQKYVVTESPVKKVEFTGYTYEKPAVSFYENPLTKYVENVTPAPVISTVHFQPTLSTFVQPEVSSYKYEPVVQQTYKSYSNQPVVQKQAVVHQSFYSVPEIQKQSVQPYAEEQVVNHGNNYENGRYVQQSYVSQPVVQKQTVLYKQPTVQPYVQKQVVHHDQNLEQKQYVQQSYVSPQPFVQKQVVYNEQPTVQPYVQQVIHHDNIYNQKEYQQNTLVSQPVVQNEIVVQQQPTVQPYSQQSFVQHDYTFGQNKYIQPVAQKEVFVQQPTIQPYIQQDISHAYDQKQYDQTLVSQPVLQQQTIVHHQPAVQSYTQEQNYNSAQKEYQQKTYVTQPVIQKEAVVYNQPTVQPYIQQQVVQHDSDYEQKQYVQPIVQQTFISQPVVQKTAVSYKQPTVIQNSFVSTEKQFLQPTVEAFVPKHIPSVITQEEYHANNGQYEASLENRDLGVTFVSTTPSTLVYEGHYQEDTGSYKNNNYKSREYLPPKVSVKYQQPSVAISSTPVSISHNYNEDVNIAEGQAEYNDNYSNGEVQQYQVTSPKPYTQGTPRLVESFHISSYDSRYQQPVSSTYSPVTYKTVSSTEKPPLVESYYETPPYSPPRESTPSTYESREYLPAKIENTYFPIVSSTPQTVYKSTTQAPVINYDYSSTARNQYLQPVQDREPIVDYQYDSGKINGYNFVTSSEAPVSYNVNPIQAYTVRKIAQTPASVAPLVRKQNLVIQTAKAQANLLGFSTVGANAGLVDASQFSTTYKTADTIPVTQSYIPVTRKFVTTTHAPLEQGIVEVTPPAHLRRIKPKVAVVTKINDYNPLLVRKLGAVCSCISPELVLKGSKSNVIQQNDYNYDYSDNYGNDENEWTQKLALSSERPVVSSTYLPAAERSNRVLYNKAVSSSTIRPIIVPEDGSYSNDFAEINAVFKSTASPIVGNEQYYSPEYTPSSTPVPSSTQQVFRGRLRGKSLLVTQAPTINSVLIQERLSPAVAVKYDGESYVGSEGESQAFDRYGPGGWRSRDETLQGSIDCQRAGLFRHPKHCNKFYACRWDCTKDRFTLHVFNCPIQLSFDPNLGACNWPSQGPSCQGDTLLPSGY